MERQLFRSGISRGLKRGKDAVDRQENIIYGYSVISKGEAKGHGLMIDEKTLDQVVALGNQSKAGVKSRFGHPNMSSTALGTFLGRAKNFRREGELVRADLHLDETAFNTPNGDLGSYVLGLAESDPDAFGSSIVFDGYEEGQVEEDGKTPKKDPQTGERLKPLARIKSLWASDVVDDPAANEGFFENTGVVLSAEVTEALNKLIDSPQGLSTVIAFLKRFEENYQSQTKENPMELSLETLKKDHKDLYEQVVAEGKQIGFSDGRDRALKVLEEAADMFGNESSALVLTLLKSEKSADQAIIALKDLKLEQLTKKASVKPGPSHDTENHVQYKDENEKEFMTNPKVQEEFRSLETYRAYVKAQKEGKVRIISK